jgi:hypothetical protein
VGKSFQYRCQIIASINICLMVFGGGKLLVDLLTHDDLELWKGTDDWKSLAPLLIFACTCDHLALIGCISNCSFRDLFDRAQMKCRAQIRLVTSSSSWHPLCSAISPTNSARTGPPMLRDIWLVLML